jgi:hypothetical protein
VGKNRKPAKGSKNNQNILPEFPSNIGKNIDFPNIHGETVYRKIEDEIKILQSTEQKKLIVLQKIRYEEDNHIEFRFGYYRIGVKGRTRGRWVWGQSALIIPKADLRSLLKKAKKRKLF